MITIKRSIFPLGEIYIKVNDENFSLWSNGEKVLENIDNVTECVVTARFMWKSTTKKLLLHKASKIKIVESISDIYYITLGTIGFALCFLLYSSLIPPIYLSVFLILYLTPITYYSLSKKAEYFKIYIE
ncbi:hypothetical protein CMU40_04755 [Elizabethkingia anophelis]|nr:hypothetical protein [Elizabethkingia anophelis]MDV3725498.1 hypothetical protein [Elizabethkingia anophelis]MDV3728721.1 hypothetical protein [Elizabethkingia anophelis]MDV3742882.1 hypothetical protein [Elizabethkingia anophelis]MDV3765328.1 hypothetical protein [Elizabethkingia anophelis]